MRRCPVLTAVVLMVSFFTIGSTRADMPGDPREAGPHSGLAILVLGSAGPALRTLDLTAEQREKIHNTLMQAGRGELGAAARAVADARQQLDIAIWDSGSTAAEISSRQQALANSSQELDTLRRSTAQQVTAMLTEGQRAALLDHMKQVPAIPNPTMMPPPHHFPPPPALHR